MNLEINNEVVRILSKIKFEEYHLKLVITMTHEVMLLANALADAKLKALLGEHFDILNLNGVYFLRSIK
jgi:hypothetical protein